MKIFNTNFEGLKKIIEKTHYDTRGYFREVYKYKFLKNKNLIFFLNLKLHRKFYP